MTRTSREHGAPAPAAVSTPVPEAEESDTVSTPAHEANESNSKTNTALNAAIRQVIESLLNDDEFVNQLTQTIQEKLLLGMKETICQEVTDSVKFDIAEQKDEITSLRKEIDELKDANDEAEQYSRRSCLIFSGIPETPDENTDDKIIQFCKNDLGVDIREEDIERSHRLGTTSTQSRTRNRSSGSTSLHSPQSSTTDSARKTRPPGPRNLIVKFTRYRKREKVYSARFNLKNVNNIVYINESLTKKRKDLFWKIRSRYKTIVSKIWTQDGRICVKLRDDRGRVNVSSENDLNKLDKYMKRQM